MICKNCGQESGTGELCAACVASEGEAAAEQKPKLSRKKLILGIGVGVLGLGMIVGDIIVLPSAIRYMQAKTFTCGIEGDYEYDDFQLCDLGRFMAILNIYVSSGLKTSRFQCMTERYRICLSLIRLNWNSTQAMGFSAMM